MGDNAQGMEGGGLLQEGLDTDQCLMSAIEY
jgi:hypothetical protein